MERRLVSLAVLAACALVPAAASAEVTIGPNPLPVPTAAMTAGSCCILTFVNGVHPAATLAAPSGGVITRWRVHEPPTQSGVMSPRVLRPFGGVFQGVATGAQVPVAAPGTLKTYATRLPIAAGDYFGVNANTGPLAAVAGANFQLYITAIANGATGASPQTSGGLIAVNADIEPDADGDGFGDETQDLGGAAAPMSPVEVGRIGPATTVTFTNTGTGNVTPDVTIDGAAAEDFLTVADRCDGVVVPAAGTCAVVLRFAPGAAGARTARLAIRGGQDSLGQVLQGSDVTLSGTGTAPPAAPVGSQSTAAVPLVALLLREDLSVRRGRTVVTSVFSTQAGDAIVRIRRGGREVATARAAVQPGRTRIRLPVARLARGRYAVALEITAAGQTARDAGRLRIRRR
jgi:hypothetical protein